MSADGGGVRGGCIWGEGLIRGGTGGRSVVLGGGLRVVSVRPDDPYPGADGAGRRLGDYDSESAAGDRVASPRGEETGG